MQESDLFFIIFLATILFTRICLYFKPISSPTIKGFRLHHYMYGIILMIIGFFINAIPIYAIGLGLFVDELPLFIIGGWHWKEYKSMPCILGVIVGILLVFILREQLVSLIS